jgi:hypothetical protein
MFSLEEIKMSFLNQSEQDHMVWICQAIELGLSPWKPGKITAYYTDNMAGDFHPFKPIITFETEILPRLPFSTELDLLGMDHHQALLKAADEAFEWFRYRRALPVEDHIIPGED